MNNYNKLLNNLETLKLLKIRDNIDNYIDLISQLKYLFFFSRPFYYLLKLHQ